MQVVTLLGLAVSAMLAYRGGLFTLDFWSTAAPWAGVVVGLTLPFLIAAIIKRASYRRPVDQVAEPEASSGSRT